MKIIHISDIHVLHLEKINIFKFLNKRLIGSFNLFFNRKKEFKTNYVEKLVTDVLSENPDHIVLTGDLTNLGLESEFKKAKEIISKLGDSSKLSIIPGNHDSYAKETVKKKFFVNYFGDWLKSSIEVKNIFPFVKILEDNIAIIGISTSVKTGPLFSAGKVSKEQLNQLDIILNNENVKNCFKIVLIHHNLHKRNIFKQFMSTVRNRKVLIDILTKHKVDMVLHGHRHKNTHYTINQNNWDLKVYECGASAKLSVKNSGNYNIYEIENKQIKSITTKTLNYNTKKFENLKEEV